MSRRDAEPEGTVHLGGTDTRAQYDGLVALYAPVAAAVFAVVLVALVWPLVRNRASRGHEPSQRQSSVKLEAGYAIGLAVIAAVLVWRTFVATSSVDAVTSKPALTVHLVAAKWNWRFEYPGGVVEQGQGVRSLPTLVVPADRPVRFTLDSRDVVHAFWVPQVRYKYDAIPGRTNVFDMAFPAGLDYADGGRCSEFCGQYHEQMRFKVSVRPPAAFAAWLRARQAEAGR